MQVSSMLRCDLQLLFCPYYCLYMLAANSYLVSTGLDGNVYPGVVKDIKDGPKIYNIFRRFLDIKSLSRNNERTYHKHLRSGAEERFGRC